MILDRTASLHEQAYFMRFHYQRDTFDTDFPFGPTDQQERWKKNKKKQLLLPATAVVA